MHVADAYLDIYKSSNNYLSLCFSRKFVSVVAELSVTLLGNPQGCKGAHCYAVSLGPHEVSSRAIPPHFIQAL